MLGLLVLFFCLFVGGGWYFLRGWGCGVQDLGFSNALNPKPGGKLQCFLGLIRGLRLGPGPEIPGLLNLGTPKGHKHKHFIGISLPYSALL